jgi:hypothetical protein
MNRCKTDIRETICQSSGECLLRLGQLARFLLRHGSRLDDVARELNVGPRVCMLSLAFLTAPDWLKVRALVENWNVLHVRSSLRSLNPPFPY